MSLTDSGSKGKNGSVYLIKSGDYYKIGLTTGTVKSRIANMQTGNPYPIELVDSFASEDAGKDESHLHNEFKNYRVQGEWFSFPQELIDCKDDWFRSCIGIGQSRMQYGVWKQRCLNGKHNLFVKYLKSRHEYAIRLLKEDTCWAIEQSAENGEVDTLLLIYRLLVDGNQFLSFKGNNNQKEDRFCYRLLTTYKNRTSLWMNDWLEVLEFVVFHSLLSGEDEYSGFEF